MRLRKLPIILFAAVNLIFSTQLIAALVVDYRMDECYFLNGAGGATGDVIDYSVNGLDGTSNGSVAIAAGQVCSASSFNGDNTNYIEVADNALLNNFTAMTVTAWVFPTSFTAWGTVVMKTTSDSWNDGWGLASYRNGGATVRFFVNGFNVRTAAVSAPINQWTHITGSYDGTTARIYVNGVLSGTSNLAFTNSTSSLYIGNEVSGGTADEWDGRIDEVKIWNTALTGTEILAIYNNELAGRNYDGTIRTCSLCSASIAAGTWSLIGIPADTRSGTVTVNDIFNSMTGVFNTDWRVYKRTYSTTDNSSSYTQMTNLTDVLDFGQGYWLGSMLNETWDTTGQPVVNYDSPHAACTANRCVEFDLTPVTKNFAVDPNDGSGPFRYNMSGFIGTVPVDWADCRFIIDGIAYTPSAADTADFASKQIWQYNPGSGSANANGYTTCDDTGIGTCKLLPYEGFWIELRGLTKGTSIQLLVPQE